MNEKNQELNENEELEDITPVEKEPFEPAPRWKRIGAWIMVGIVTLGIINWLISIAYPDWPQYIMGLFR